MSDARSAKFRETLWFLKGNKDAEAADEAALSGDLLATDRADLLPIEDRYQDDGTVHASMSRAFGLHTGTTSYLPRFHPTEPSGTTLYDKALIADLKRGRMKIVAAIGACVAVIAGVLVFAV